MKDEKLDYQQRRIAMKCSKHQTEPTRCFCLIFLSSYLLIFFLFPSLGVAYDFAGGTGDPNDPYQIATAGQLISMGSDPNLMDKHYVLLNDIDLDPNLPDSRIFTDAVIAPPIIGPDGEIQYLHFEGRFDGSGFAIHNLTISGGGGLGLFYTLLKNAQVIDLGVLNAKVTGIYSPIGIIVGRNQGTVIHCHSTGTVSGTESVGGLAGSNSEDAVINDCYSDVAVSGENRIGGLVGNNRHGSVTDCHSTGSVSWTGLDLENAHSFGGLIGINWGTVVGCYSHSTTSGILAVGGLVGANRFSNSTVSNCYSTGRVSGTWGYVGYMDNGVGGLVGWNEGEVKHSYSTGRVSGNVGNEITGGLIGHQSSYSIRTSTKNCFWDINTSGLDKSGAGTGLTTHQMQDIQTFLNAGWDFVDETRNGVLDVWRMPDGAGYPILGQEQIKLLGQGTPGDPYLISTVVELSSVRRYQASAFRLMANLDLAASQWSTAIVPEFSGSFDGNGFVIINMSISGRDDDLGLFGKLEEGAEVHDLGVVDISVGHRGPTFGDIGGIVGENEGHIFNCFSTGAVYGDSSVGGIVGRNRKGSVSTCYSATTVSGESKIGGIVGENKAAVSNCYSSGEVRGNYAGGIVGSNEGDVSNCYSTSAVSSAYPLTVGGLAGRTPNSSERATSSFWDIETSGQTESLGGVGLRTYQMQDIATYLAAGWDFSYSPLNSPDKLWWMPEQGYPRLWWQYGHAYAPSPAHMARNVSPGTILHWNFGGPDLRHDVYFGEDEALVVSATRESLDVYLGPLAAGIETYDPGVLEWRKTYYWRIDGINEIDPNGPWQGEVWSFTTTDSVPVFTVDDFESYDDLCNRIFFTWQDGWGHSGGENIEACNAPPYDGNGSNALVGNADPPFAEQVIVRGGGQSLPMDYDNENWPWFSEAQRTWSTPQDWTDDGADALVLYFQGNEENTQDSLYIAAEDRHGAIAVLLHPDAQAVRAAEWREWRVPLNDLDTAGVGVTTIRKLMIGVGDRDNPRSGGTGRIYIDDIQLIKGVL